MLVVDSTPLGEVIVTLNVAGVVSDTSFSRVKVARDAALTEVLGMLKFV